MRDPVRGVIHNMHRIKPPPPAPHGLTNNGIHLNLSLGLSNEPGSPQKTRLTSREGGRATRLGGSKLRGAAKGASCILPYGFPLPAYRR